MICRLKPRILSHGRFPLGVHLPERMPPSVLPRPWSYVPVIHKRRAALIIPLGITRTLAVFLTPKDNGVAG